MIAAFLGSMFLLYRYLKPVISALKPKWSGPAYMGGIFVMGNMVAVAMAEEFHSATATYACLGLGAAAKFSDALFKQKRSFLVIVATLYLSCVLMFLGMFVVALQMDTIAQPSS